VAVPLLSFLTSILLYVVIAMASIFALAVVVFLLALAWRAPRRHSSMSFGYCAMQTFCMLVLKCFYKLRVRGVENFPESGPVLVLANHVAYADVLVVGVLSRRPVRFLSWEGFEGQKFLGFMCRMMGTIPVSETKAKDAIIKSAEALKRGEVVCIFPEGSLTRNGSLMQLRKGFELIARRGGAPILPIAIDGMWGSFLSFSGGKFFWKLPQHFPRPIGVVIGKPFPAEEGAQTRLRLLELSAEAFSMRPSLEKHLSREMVRGLAQKGGSIAMVDLASGRKEFSASTLLALSWAFAAELKRRTNSKRVAIVLPPGIGATVANLGCVLADKVPVNLNFSLGREQAESCLRRAGVNLLVTAGAFRAKLSERSPDFPWGDQVLDVADFQAVHSRFDLGCRVALIRSLPASWLKFCMGLPRHGGDEEAALLFTSGSSGQPKGVRLSHRNLLANLRQIENAEILPEEGVFLSSLPVFHSFGFTIGLWYCLSRSPRLVTLPSPLDSAAAVKAIKDEKVTVVVGTPTFLRPYVRRGNAADFATLEWAVVGAEKCPNDLVDAFIDKLETPILEGYGITETSPVLSVNVPNHSDPEEAPGGVWVGTVRGSVGRPVIGVAIRFIDPVTEAVLPSDQVGLLEVRGANIFMGYLDAEQTAKAMTPDGWYRTGDLGRMDDDGFLHLAGRLSRFSKIGGEMVPHGTVEDALRKVLGLISSMEVKVAVSSAAEAAKGEQLVVLHVDDLDVESVRNALAAEGLANLWIPKVFKKVPVIPILGTGKLDLNKLRELAQG
jgi:acyl-[acyl-carrier-protein]-phospholipid O-acyltransferase / long-chain-fatty-acid--[acyl-carrier-protein] ligase